MKNKPILLVLLILICCNSDKISEKSIDLNNKAVNSLRSEKYSEALKYSEEAILADDSNIYFSLLLIGDAKSQSKMKELENKWKNNIQTYQSMISLKKLGEKELINKMLTE